MKIAILYIATGKYIVFWKDFFTSCEQYFLPGLTKEYFVFTDAERFEFSDSSRVHTIHQQKLEWPYATLLRFRSFQTIKKELGAFDYIFFFNANMLFVQTITADEFLPDTTTDDGLLVTQHPGFFDKEVKDFTYEQKQTDSLAYIKPGDGKYYFMGGLNGGTATAYLKLIETLDKNITTDLEKGIIALWHDESHLNRYMLDKNPKILSPAYGYSEGRKLPFEPKIIIRDKNNYGGHDFLREQKTTFLNSVFRWFKKLIK